LAAAPNVSRGNVVDIAHELIWVLSPKHRIKLGLPGLAGGLVLNRVDASTQRCASAFEVSRSRGLADLRPHRLALLVIDDARPSRFVERDIRVGRSRRNGVPRRLPLILDALTRRAGLLLGLLVLIRPHRAGRPETLRSLRAYGVLTLVVGPHGARATRGHPGEDAGPWDDASERAEHRSGPAEAAPPSV
jgi:hypothetical protein